MIKVVTLRTLKKVFLHRKPQKRPKKLYGHCFPNFFYVALCQKIFKRPYLAKCCSVNISLLHETFKNTKLGKIIQFFFHFSKSHSSENKHLSWQNAFLLLKIEGEDLDLRKFMKSCQRRCIFWSPLYFFKH